MNSEDKDVLNASGNNDAEPSSKRQNDAVIASDVSNQESGDGKPDYRKHRLSTGVLIIWLMATAVLSMVVGGFAGAIVQKGIDEKNFEIERNSLNDKITILESTAEENQKELVELREFRKKLEDLITEYMILDQKKQAENILNDTSNTVSNSNEERAVLPDGEEEVVAGTEQTPSHENSENGNAADKNANSGAKSSDKSESIGLFEWLMSTSDKTDGEKASEENIQEHKEQVEPTEQVGH